MPEDSIVAEVHRIRRDIMAEFRGDFRAYFRYIQALEKADQAAGVPYVTLAPRRPEGYAAPRAGVARGGSISSRGLLRRHAGRGRGR